MKKKSKFEKIITTEWPVSNLLFSFFKLFFALQTDRPSATITFHWSFIKERPYLMISPNLKSANSMKCSEVKYIKNSSNVAVYLELLEKAV